MNSILQSYKDLYNQILGELAANNLTHNERKTLIEMLYNTEMNIHQAKTRIN